MADPINLNKASPTGLNQSSPQQVENSLTPAQLPPSSPAANTPAAAISASSTTPSAQAGGSTQSASPGLGAGAVIPSPSQLSQVPGVQSAVVATTVQNFNRVIGASDGQSFTVMLPTPIASGNYAVVATLAVYSVFVMIACPKSSRTSTGFTCETSGQLAVGDSIDFEVTAL